MTPRHSKQSQSRYRPSLTPEFHFLSNVKSELHYRRCRRRKAWACWRVCRCRIGISSAPTKVELIRILQSKFQNRSRNFKRKKPDATATLTLVRVPTRK